MKTSQADEYAKRRRHFAFLLGVCEQSEEMYDEIMNPVLIDGVANFPPRVAEAVVSLRLYPQARRPLLRQDRAVNLAMGLECFEKATPDLNGFIDLAGQKTIYTDDQGIVILKGPHGEEWSKQLESYGFHRPLWQSSLGG
jgi:hypothetical protein